MSALAASIPWFVGLLAGCGGVGEPALVVTENVPSQFRDRDGDGFGAGEPVALESCARLPAGACLPRADDCDDGDPAVHPGASEWCDGVDNDCDGFVDEGFDEDGDGVTTCEGDCDDDNAMVFPGLEDLCDNLDNDCDGQIDEDGSCG